MMRFLNWKGGNGPKPNGNGIRYDNATPSTIPTIRTSGTTIHAGLFVFCCPGSVINSLSPLSPS